jgi:WD40 repeat protein
VLLTLTGHNSDVWNGVFSPDGRTLATISFDGTARLWDVPGAGSDGELGEGRESAGSEVLKLDGGNDGRDLAFSPDGRFLATTSGNGIVRVYVLPIEDLMALAEERVTRALTTAECQKFMHLEQCAVGR